MRAGHAALWVLILSVIDCISLNIVCVSCARRTADPDYREGVAAGHPRVGN